MRNSARLDDVYDAARFLDCDVAATATMRLDLSRGQIVMRRVATGNILHAGCVLSATSGEREVEATASNASWSSQTRRLHRRLDGTLKALSRVTRAGHVAHIRLLLLKHGLDELRQCISGDLLRRPVLRAALQHRDIRDLARRDRDLDLEVAVAGADRGAFELPAGRSRGLGWRRRGWRRRRAFRACPRA